MKKITAEQNVLLEQLQHIAQGLGETFAPFCEVVVHDLMHPRHAILSIHNNLSGRKVGDPATELGLARISDPQFPQLISNYANQFPDGRQAKSTSIGIKDSSGDFVAALCMNVDLTLFRGLQNVLSQFGSAGAGAEVHESLDPSNAETLRNRIDQFAARRATTARALSAKDRRTLMRELKKSGCLDVRRSMETAAQHLGVSRATVYSDAK
jgi:predicted transcriptional regulator YheO